MLDQGSVAHERRPLQLVVIIVSGIDFDSCTYGLGLSDEWSEDLFVTLVTDSARAVGDWEFPANRLYVGIWFGKVQLGTAQWDLVIGCGYSAGSASHCSG